MDLLDLSPGLLTICRGGSYTCAMHALETISLVLATAVLWAVFTTLMLARLNRTVRRARRQERKASRIKNRPLNTEDPDENGKARRHHLKAWTHHPFSPRRRASQG